MYRSILKTDIEFFMTLPIIRISNATMPMTDRSTHKNG